MKRVTFTSQELSAHTDEDSYIQRRLAAEGFDNDQPVTGKQELVYIYEQEEGNNMKAAAPWAANNKETKTVFIVIHNEHETGKEAIKAVKGSKEEAHEFIVNYVLGTEVNTGYLHMVKKDVEFDKEGAG